MCRSFRFDIFFRRRHRGKDCFSPSDRREYQFHINLRKAKGKRSLMMNLRSPSVYLEVLIRTLSLCADGFLGSIEDFSGNFSKAPFTGKLLCIAFYLASDKTGDAIEFR